MRHFIKHDVGGEGSSASWILIGYLIWCRNGYPAEPILKILLGGLHRCPEPTQKWSGKRKSTKLPGWLLLASNLVPDMYC